MCIINQVRKLIKLLLLEVMSTLRTLSDKLVVKILLNYCKGKQSVTIVGTYLMVCIINCTYT